jgi:hypothetical protein
MMVSVLMSMGMVDHPHGRVTTLTVVGHFLVIDRDHSLK